MKMSIKEKAEYKYACRGLKGYAHSRKAFGPNRKVHICLWYRIFNQEEGIFKGATP